jgi:hypothetical protein
MAEPTEQIQTTIPSWLKDPILQLVAKSQALADQGYQPYARQKVDAQGRPVFDAQGKPVLEGIQRVEGFNPAQIAAFDSIAAMREADQLRQATGFAGLAGLNAPQLGRYQAYGERVPMGGVDNWGAGEKYDKSKIPSNFDWQAYVSAPQNSDLIKAGIDTPEEAERHYAKYGAGEGRVLGTPGSTFQSSAFYMPPSFERMPTSFERVVANTSSQQQMAGIPGVLARGIEAGRMGPAREVTGERVSAPSMAGYERLGTPGEYGVERATGAGYGPLAMGPAERVGLGALQQYRMGVPERISGPMGPERVSGPQLREFQMSPAQQVRAAELERLGMVAPRDVTAQQLQQFRMASPERVGAERVSAGDLRAAQTGFRPDLQAFEMGPAERVGAEKFGLGAMQEYMSPYMQGVVEAQKRAATREYMQGLPAIGAQAARMGGRGGTRETLLQSEAQRSLAQRLSDIEAQGLQQAYQQATSQFGQDRAAQMQAALANQQAGLTVGQQNLASRLGVQQLGTQTGLQTALANLSNEQQALVQQEANRLQASGMNQQAAMQAALANQQAGLTVGQQNLAAEQARQQFLGQQSLQAQLANQQAGLTTGQQNLAALLGVQQLGAGQDIQAQLANQAAQQTTGQTNLQALLNQYQFGAGQGLQAQQLNQQAQLQQQQQALAQLAQANQFSQQNAAQRAQYGLAGANLAEQSRQFGAGLGLQGLQQQLAAAGTLGGLGQTQYGQQMGITSAQLGAGGQMQAMEQQLLNQQLQDFINKQQLPYKQAEFGMGILRGIPATGQTSTLYQQPGSLFGQIAGVGLGLGSLFGGLGSKSS